MRDCSGWKVRLNHQCTRDVCAYVCVYVYTPPPTHTHTNYCNNKAHNSFSSCPLFQEDAWSKQKRPHQWTLFTCTPFHTSIIPHSTPHLHHPIPHHLDHDSTFYTIDTHLPFKTYMVTPWHLPNHITTPTLYTPLCVRHGWGFTANFYIYAHI